MTNSKKPNWFQPVTAAESAAIAAAVTSTLPVETAVSRKKDNIRYIGLIVECNVYIKKYNELTGDSGVALIPGCFSDESLAAQIQWLRDYRNNLQANIKILQAPQPARFTLS